MSEPDPNRMPRGHYWIGTRNSMTSVIRVNRPTPPTYFRYGHTTIYRGFGVRTIERQLYNPTTFRPEGAPLREVIRPGEAQFRPAGTYHSVRLLPDESGSSGDATSDSGFLSCDKDFGDGNSNE